MWSCGAVGVRSLETEDIEYYTHSNMSNHTAIQLEMCYALQRCTSCTSCSLFVANESLDAVFDPPNRLEKVSIW